MTADQVVEAAVRLTVRHGIDGWTIRALAQELGVAQAVVYHHVGGRRQLVRSVARRVVELIPLPEFDLSWRQWFGVLLTDIRRVALHHPGVARHLVVLGPVAGAQRVIDAGMRVLGEAGFDDEAAMIYNYLANTALSLIAVEDERNADPDERVELAREVAEMAGDPVNEGMAAMGEWLRSRAVTIDHLRASDAQFYRFCVERALDGAQARLAVVKRRSGRRQRVEQRSTETLAPRSAQMDA
ncbi:TetR family transcriptional regulator [Lentzea sp. NBRC 102530]|uniref:TetR family transcriptional regulator n=1 Tax=Lentzea sp. NBRC 102530 TaxID=3032201 RepID=UPI0024A36D59|nr:TetR family transcriptional regulator [Lentzea sp. NBRC 102530]GLY51415.1 TetR family transcriptional regulator [Lentzea sp. NBRC 102530]